MKPIWTNDQQKVIDLRERNILVSAAAGSGKTAVLVQRIVEKITDEKHPVDVDRLLVVTFTRAAAAEMRERIEKVLEEKLQEMPENENLQRQLSLLHNAQITTIDSFCQYVIRNYFHVIHMDPMFRVGDETDLQLMRERVLEELLEEKYRVAQEEQDEKFLCMMQQFSTGRTDKKVEELVQKIYTISQSYPMPERQLQQWQHIYDVETIEQLEQQPWMKELVLQIKDCVNGYIRMAEQALLRCTEIGGPEAYAKTIANEKAQFETIQNCRTYEELYVFFSGISFGRLSPCKKKDTDVFLREEVKKIREMYKEKGIEKWRETCFFQTPEEMVKDFQKMRTSIKQLLQLTEEFACAYQDKKQESGVIDFGDMEHYALRILTEETESGEIVPTKTAIELQELYDEILVDEYQDSNYVQEMLLTSISRGPQQKPYFFMVGDVKQSIYQFRLARPDLFMEKYNAYTTEDSKTQRIDLQNNFRSRAGVLEFANLVFESIMRKEFGGIDYDDAAKLVPAAEFGDTEQRIAEKTQILLLEQESSGGKKTKIQQEALAIGEKIQDMIRGVNPMHIKGAQGYRPVEYGDIVILLRSMQGWAETMQETLSDMGIPAYAPKATGYFTAWEVEIILDFLRIIDNPRQDIPLAAVLRSPLFSVSDEELAYLGTMEDALCLWDKIIALVAGEAVEKDASRALPQETKTDPSQPYTSLEKTRRELQVKLTYFVESIERYREMTGIRSVYDILQDIYQKYDFYSIMAAMPGGEQRSGNLDVLLQQALQFANNGHQGVFGFCNYIEQLRKSDIDFGEASVIDAGSNCVQIISIHKSKGLEFPVVFIAGMGKSFNTQDTKRSVLVDADWGIGVDCVDLEHRVSQPSLVKKVMARNMTRNLLMEEIRVLYVAMTRAKEQLILCGVVKNVSKKLQSWHILGTLSEQPDVSGAGTYLDMMMPVLCRGQWYKELEQESIFNEEETEEQRIVGEDTLYCVEIQFPQHKIEREKEEIAEILQAREDLKHRDISVVCHEELAALYQQQKTYRYPFVAGGELPVKVSVSELKHRAMEIEEADRVEVIVPTEEETSQLPMMETLIPQPAYRQQQKTISAGERGTLYHLILEHIPYEEADENYDFRKLLDRLQMQGFLSEEERVLVQTKKLSVFMASSLGKRMKAAYLDKTLRREQPFMLGVPAKEIYPDIESDEMILVQGIIDACFLEDDQWILVDYKTDSVKLGQEKLLCDRYREQLRYYGKALQQLTGIPVKEKIIYSLSLGKELTL